MRKDKKDVSAAGHLHKEETFEDAAVRIIKSEMGIAYPRKDALYPFGGSVGRKKIGSKDFSGTPYYDEWGIYHYKSREENNKEISRMFIYILNVDEERRIAIDVSQRNLDVSYYASLEGLIEDVMSKNSHTQFTSTLLQWLSHPNNKELVKIKAYELLREIVKNMIKFPRQADYEFEALAGFGESLIKEIEDWRLPKEMPYDINLIKKDDPEVFTRRKSIALKDWRVLTRRAMLLTSWYKLVNVYGGKSIGLGQIHLGFEFMRTLGPEAEIPSVRALLYVLLKSAADLEIKEDKYYVFTREGKPLAGIRLSQQGKLEVEERVKEGLILSAGER